MRKLLIFIFYSFILLLVGRNLTVIPPIRVAQQQEAKDAESIRAEILKFLKNQDGEYSIYYEDFKTGEAFGIQENSVITAASMNKLPIVGCLYYMAAKKQIDLEEKIVIQQEDIQDYGTGSLRYEDPGQAYTLKYLAQLTLQKSDNTAAHVLYVRLGADNVQYFASQLEMAATSMVDNDSSARDIGRFLSSLYQSKFTTPALSKEILGFIENTDIEDRIPKYLPKNIHIYHKTGDAVGNIHDGGIVDNGKNPYILVVMTDSIKDEAKTKDNIAQISRQIYNLRGGK